MIMIAERAKGRCVIWRCVTSFGSENADIRYVYIVHYTIVRTGMSLFGKIKSIRLFGGSNFWTAYLYSVQWPHELLSRV